ncbi:MAG: TerB family tellurite resistance protein [Deltaproteobacteria bacterium]|nr:TerB family tellurite resistance protein [Deltaproteobacteria bacterium]
MKDRIEHVADILMAAAYADQHLAGDERAAVRQLLKQLLDAETLPMDLDFRIDEFAAGTFDLKKAAAVFVNDPPEVKRHLLELVAAIHAADQEFDLAEDEFVHRLGEALGLPHSSYKDMIISVVDEVDLAEGLDEVRFAAEDAEARPPMPPPPGSKRAKTE